MMTFKAIDRKKYPSFGECIYCGDKDDLTDEHIIPFSLNGNAYIEDGSCRRCAAITTSLEDAVSAKVFASFRTHNNIQTRRPKLRPTEGIISYKVNSGKIQTLKVAIKDLPYCTPMPVWGSCGLMKGALPTEDFENYKAHLFYFIPPNIKSLLQINDGDFVEIEMPKFQIKHEEFARAIAKIGACQAVVSYGLYGFRRLNIPQLILGNYPFISYLVGSQILNPLPPNYAAQHEIKLMHTSYGNLKFITAKIRLFMNAGFENFGPPYYEVVVGAPLLSNAPKSKTPIRKYSSYTKKVIFSLSY